MLHTRRLSIGPLAAILAAWAAYAVPFLLLYPEVGLAATALSALPVLVTGALLGTWAGVGAAAFAFALAFFLLGAVGEPAWALVSGGGLLDTALNIVIGFSVGRLADFSHRLRQEAAERERLEQQLLHSQKMEAIGRLAGGIAHDFNNLLTAMIGYATFAKNALAHDAAIAGDIEHVLKAARRAADLTRQLLAFSRRQFMTLQVVDPNELLLDLSPTLRRLLGEEVVLELVPGDGLSHVRADRVQIQQALMNLALNARDAMPAGGRLRIATTHATLDEAYAGGQPDVSAGEFVLISVSDNGAGMTEHVRSHLFEPFFTTKEVGKGTGLGLATAFGIVKQHGGNLLCESAPGRGTTFRIYLPQVSDGPRRAGQGDDAAALPRGSETVLVAEDQADVRQLVSRLLRSLGYEVLEAANGEEALQVARSRAGPIDLLVSDLVMPRLGGLQLVAMLRQTWPDLPALLLSSYAAELPMRDENQKQGLFFLCKPLGEASLARLARQALDSEKAGQHW